jgi:hypothetical protein
LLSSIKFLMFFPYQLKPFPATKKV